MKNILLLFVCVALNVKVFANVKAPIQQVQIFSNGAEVIRTGIAHFNADVDTIIVKGLSPFVKQNTIQCKINDAKILDVWYTINHNKLPNDSPELKKVKADIKMVELQILNVKDELQYLKFEYSMIETNKAIKGEATLDIDDVKDFVFYYKSKLPSLIKSITDTKQQLKKYEVVLGKLKKQLKEIQNQPIQKTGEIYIVAKGGKNTKRALELKYHVNNCGWSPLYNLRAISLNEPISFEYNAMVHQNTGVNWENCKLIVSTGNPVLTGYKPQLYTWRLREGYRTDGYFKSRDEDELMEFRSLDKDGKAAKKKISYSGFDNAEPLQKQQLTFSSFEIPNKFSLNSGTKNKRVHILQRDLPATYNYYAVPKKHNGVFLVANLTQWEKLPLIPGKSQIYFDGTFVGKSYLNPANMKDTLTLSLGQDKSILVERKKVEDECVNGSNMLGAFKKRAYVIKVKNNRSKAITIKVMDQVPVSSNNKIKVDFDLGKGWVINEETGILEWNLEVPANNKASSEFRFEVKHPKKMVVSLE